MKNAAIGGLGELGKVGVGGAVAVSEAVFFVDNRVMSGGDE